MSTFVLHHPDVVVMEMDKEGKARVFVGYSTSKECTDRTDALEPRNVYEFEARVKGRLDDLPPRLRAHWHPNTKETP